MSEESIRMPELIHVEQWFNVYRCHSGNWGYMVGPFHSKDGADGAAEFNLEERVSRVKFLSWDLEVGKFDE